MYQKIGTAAQFIEGKTSLRPTVGIVLGSGLGDFVQSLKESVAIPYTQIPHFRPPSVEGHEGQLVIGKIGPVAVAVMQGRIHFYEGASMAEVVFPIRVLKAFGVKNLILTNAAGGINANFRPGDLVIIKDHINLLGQNPLVGANIPELGPRFPDMTHAYRPELQKILQKAGKAHGLKLKSGVYLAVSGPTYETPAEIKAFKRLGADMVGMSTVPESIVANHMGMNVAGISCITNKAAGISKTKLSHQEVKEVALKVKDKMAALLQAATLLIALDRGNK